MAVIERTTTNAGQHTVTFEVHNRTNPPNRLSHVAWTSNATALQIHYQVWDNLHNGLWEGYLQGASGTQNLPNTTLQQIEPGIYSIPENYEWKMELVAWP